MRAASSDVDEGPKSVLSIVRMTPVIQNAGHHGFLSPKI
jgi:hypothetical protein